MDFNSNDVWVNVGSARGSMIGYLMQHTDNDKLIDVELNQEIYKLSKNIFQDDKVKLILGDMIVNTPEKATVSYLFNPFNDVVLEKFLDAVENKIKQSVRIFYLYPSCKSMFDRRFKN